MKELYIQNNTSEYLGVPELQITIPPGITNLYSLNEKLTEEKIERSKDRGVLKALFENNIITIANRPKPNVIIASSPEPQVFPNRARFAKTNIPVQEIPQEDMFDTDKIVSAAKLYEEMAQAVMVKPPQDTNPIQEVRPSAVVTEFVPKPYLDLPKVTTEKMKNDMKMGYDTCAGRTATGQICKRQAIPGSQYCGLHNQERVDRIAKKKEKEQKKKEKKLEKQSEQK